MEQSSLWRPQRAKGTPASRAALAGPGAGMGAGQGPMFSGLLFWGLARPLCPNLCRCSGRRGLWALPPAPHPRAPAWPSTLLPPHPLFLGYLTPWCLARPGCGGPPCSRGSECEEQNQLSCPTACIPAGLPLAAREKGTGRAPHASVTRAATCSFRCPYSGKEGLSFAQINPSLRVGKRSPREAEPLPKVTQLVR